MKLEGFRIPVFGVSLGAFATLSQVVVLRELLVIGSGSELAAFLALCPWLACVATGALLARVRPGVLPTLPVLAIILALPAPLCVEALRHLRWLIDLPVGAFPQVHHRLLPSLAGAALPAMAVGMLFTVCAALPAANRRIPRLYIFEAAGALAAGLLFSFVLSGHASHPAILLCPGRLVVASTAPFTSGAKVPAAAVGLLAAALAPFPQVAALDDASLARAFRHLPAAGRYQGCTDSRYGRLCLGDADGQFQLYRDGRFAYAFPDPWERATPVHLALAAHGAPRRILIIGGGMPDRVEAALAHDAMEVTYLYRDATEHRLVTRTGWSPPENEAGRVTVAINDPGRFMKAGEPFDVVLLFAPEPISAADNSLRTREFFADIALRLATGGLFLLQVQGSANVPTQKVAAVLAGTRSTLEAVFKEVALVPGVDTAFIASPQARWRLDPALLERRLMALGDPTGAAGTMRSRLNPRRVHQLTERLDQSGGRVYRDNEPRAMFESLLRHLEQQAGTPAQAGWQLWIFRVSGLLGLLPVIVFTVRRRRGRPPRPEDSVFSTGAAAMVAQVAILFLFSARHGGLYQHIAWIVAGFMAGVALGALAAQRPFAAAKGRLADLLVVAVMLPLAVSSHLPQPAWVTAVWTLAAGAATGFAFPVFLARLQHHLCPGAAAARLEAADHMGAALGALAAALAWLPLLGVAWTCALLAAWKIPLVIPSRSFFRRNS